MAKKTSAIIGVTFAFRSGKASDALRAWVFKNDKIHHISAKIHPTLKKINKLLKEKRLREGAAEKDADFVTLKQKLEHELRCEHGLAIYKAIEKIDMKTKEFDFETSLDKFEIWKKRTSVSYTYRRTMEFFWFPFLLKDLKIIHPSELAEYQDEIMAHVLAHKKPNGEPISHESYNSYFKAINQYVAFCVAKKFMGESSAFKVWWYPTLEERKRQQFKRKRSSKTYSVNDLVKIKEKIDKTFNNPKNPRPEKLLEAYAMFFGVCTGLRQGNILGLKGEDLFPDHKIPHFRVSDNIVSGYSRGEQGAMVFENSTKTTFQEDEDEDILLPMIQPNKEIVVEVARYLKKNIGLKDRICGELTPGGFYRKWKRIASECQFQFLNPHNWKHSYATNGADNLEAWYNGNPRLLQLCCLHSSFKMTEKYIKKRFPKSLEQFAPKTDD